ncbi:hypothetical protein KR51_00003280 [Rubidibacter lacunae KORDI 51-2]|uniref:Uncharacterized protein n=1 Tax=Rubidibacter lacunae KORDI 51-2 TaxID=582515 RepID=U5DTL3_9CHRO|nr:hypothetical protein KR51_00003280 [Rubidibacter lacunae KORDI 51-2]
MSTSGFSGRAMLPYLSLSFIALNHDLGLVGHRRNTCRTVACQLLLPRDDAGGRDGLNARGDANAQAFGAHFQAVFDPLDGSAQPRHGVALLSLTRRSQPQHQ